MLSDAWGRGIGPAVEPGVATPGSAGPHTAGVSGPHADEPTFGVEVPRDWDIDNGWMTENRPWPFESAAENHRLSPAAVVSACRVGVVVALVVIPVIR